MRGGRKKSVDRACGLQPNLVGCLRRSAPVPWPDGAVVCHCHYTSTFSNVTKLATHSCFGLSCETWYFIFPLPW
jgi:hypothetical protein